MVPGVLACGWARRREVQLWLSISNFVRNSSMTHSKFGFASLELQRFWVSRKMTAINYVRHLAGGDVVAAHGHRSLASPRPHRPRLGHTDPSTQAEPQLKPHRLCGGEMGVFGAFFGCRGVVGFNGYCSGASSGVWGFKFLVIAAYRGGTSFICQLPELWDGSLVAPWCSGCRRARPSAKPAGPCCAVGGGSPASRPRRELRSARRLVVRPGPAAARGHRSKAQAARGGLGLCTVSRR